MTPTTAKTYTWLTISSMQDGQEFSRSDCKIDWGLFLEYVTAIIEARVLWPSDVNISKDGDRVKRVG